MGSRPLIEDFHDDFQIYIKQIIEKLQLFAMIIVRIYNIQKLRLN